jgi:hypothetical protein
MFRNRTTPTNLSASRHLGWGREGVNCILWSSDVDMVTILKVIIYQYVCDTHCFAAIISAFPFVNTVT